MRKFVIKHSDKFYVSGFSKSQGMITITENINDAKTYKTMNGGIKFAEKYMDCGFGLSSKTCSVVEVF